MPYCGKCGKWLNEGERCDCSSLADNGQNAVRESPCSEKYDPNFDPYIRRYVDDPYMGAEKKSSKVLIFVVIFVILCILSLFAASILIPAYYSRKKSERNKKLQSIAYDASALNKAADDTLYELNLQEVELQGLYFISSDSESNVAVPFDAELFYDELADHLNKPLKDCQYFIVIRNGKAEYTATAYNWTEGLINTCPSQNGSPVSYELDSEGVPVSYRMNLDEIYWKTYYQIFREE